LEHSGEANEPATTRIHRLQFNVGGRTCHVLGDGQSDWWRRTPMQPQLEPQVSPAVGVLAAASGQGGRDAIVSDHLPQVTTARLRARATRAVDGRAGSQCLDRALLGWRRCR
jgi:hypothetical protein